MAPARRRPVDYDPDAGGVADTAEPHGATPDAVGAPPAKYTPTVTALHVMVRRSVWTEEPRGQWETEARISAEPDPGYTTGQNLDRLHAAARQAVERWMAQLPGTAS